MATYNKPGVYVEETLVPSKTVTNGSAASVAAFVGVADRGPTTLATDNTTVIPVPTLVQSWAEFTDQFSFSSVASPFTSTVESNSDDLNYAVKSFFENGGSQAYISRVVATDAAAASITLTAAGPVNAVTIKAKNPGVWGNKVWVVVSTNTSNVTYFDLSVHYSETATASADLSTSNLVEKFTFLSMAPTNSRYAPGIVTSSFITVALNAANTSYLSPSVKSIALAGGTKGSTAANVATQVLPQLDSIEGPLVLNWTDNAQEVFQAVTNKVLATNVATLTVATTHTIVTGDNISVFLSDSSFNGSFVVTATGATTVSYAVTKGDVSSTAASGVLVVSRKSGTTAGIAVANATFTYAKTRGDVFVVSDVQASTSLATILSTISTYNTDRNYGAAYYPRLVVPDPISRTGGTISIAPGGAVTAAYVNADAQRGAFQAPAGTGTRLSNVVAVQSVSAAEFAANSDATVQVNIIRFVPGSGICIMGARTLSSSLNDRYVPTRRSLQYINKSLTNATEFAIFEPNDDILWSRVRSVVDSFLYGYWRQGGLKGVKAGDAYYVRCDSTINNQGSIDNGELRIEVGVALQKPAEFIIIKIGQMDGSTSVTTTL